MPGFLRESFDAKIIVYEDRQHPGYRQVVIECQAPSTGRSFITSAESYVSGPDVAVERAMRNLQEWLLENLKPLEPK